MDNLEYITGLLRGLYKGMDQATQEALVMERGVSCKRGCYWCCKIVACASLVEGYVIGGLVLAMPRAQRVGIVRRLQEVAVPLGMANDEYALLGHHCGFLDMDTKDCVIYEDRPASCRYHVVVSPPEDCKPGEPHQIMQFDMVELEHMVHELSNKIFDAVIAAPVPNMVLHCMEALDPTQRYAPEGVASPMEWTQFYRRDPEGEIAEMRKALNASRQGVIS